MSDIELLRKRKGASVNDKHASSLSFNERIALRITVIVGSMWCAYLFALIAFVGFPFKGGTPLEYVLWLSSEFLQLVLLPIIIVGQNVQAKHAALMADEQFKLVKKIDRLVERLEKESEDGGRG
jgi:uncharacterized membrane protein